MSIFRKISVTGAALLIAGACLLVMGVFILDSKNADETSKQQTIDNQYVGCLRYNDTRLLFRSVILDAYGASDRQDFDITSLSAFQRLQDPANKELLEQLTSNPSGGDGTNDRRDRSYNRTGTRPCEQEYPTHSRGLDLSTTVTVPPPAIATP